MWFQWCIIVAKREATGFLSDAVIFENYISCINEFSEILLDKTSKIDFTMSVCYLFKDSGHYSKNIWKCMKIYRDKETLNHDVSVATTTLS